jgi:hypothetical protein
MNSREQREESRGRDCSFRNLMSWKKAQALLLCPLDRQTKRVQSPRDKREEHVVD